MSLQRLAAALTLVVAAIATLACAALSPYALAAAGDLMRLNWKNLADVGQAYGATSALISALALAGVAASIAYQVRAVRQQRHQAFRDQHRELFMLLIDDPETYAPAFSHERAAMDPVELRRDVYAQMWLQLYLFAYETGHWSKAFLQSTDGIESLFNTEYHRRHWARSRPLWMSDPSRNVRRFARILDDGYQKVLAAGPLSEPEPHQPVKIDLPDKHSVAGHLVLGAAVLVAGGSAGAAGPLTSGALAVVRQLLGSGSLLVGSIRMVMIYREPGALPGSAAPAQAREAGVFTMVHEAFWTAAVKPTAQPTAPGR